jgi:flagellar motor switch protein FliN/FliY
MTIKKPDMALETGVELFLTAFNKEISNDGGLLRNAAVEPPPDTENRWFRQAFTGSTNFELLAGISTQAVDSLPGSLTELLENVFRSMAGSLGAAAGSVVACGMLTEEESPRQPLEEIACELFRGSRNAGWVILAVPQPAISFLRAIASRTRPPHLDALLGVDLPVTISFGTTEMALAEVMKLTTGSIVQFDHLLNEPVNVVVNDCLVARGDVVVVDGNYGVRISEVLARTPR